jgi:hypothetical protein
LQSGFNEQQVRAELLSEIGDLEESYKILQDIRLGVTYDVADIRGTLQKLKENLSKVRTLFALYTLMKGSKFELAVDPFISTFDLALTMMSASPQLNPSDVIQTLLSLLPNKIENFMSSLGVLKRMI